MFRDVIQTDKAPKAIGPYSQAVRSAGLIYLSGQLGMGPATGQLVQGGVGPLKYTPSDCRSQSCSRSCR